MCQTTSNCIRHNGMEDHRCAYLCICTSNRVWQRPKNGDVAASYPLPLFKRQCGEPQSKAEHHFFVVRCSWAVLFFGANNFKIFLNVNHNVYFRGHDVKFYSCNLSTILVIIFIETHFFCFQQI